MPTQKFYSDVDLKHNEVKQAVIERVAYFPANAREGQVVYNTILKNKYTCIDDTIDTTLSAAWRVGEFNVDNILVNANGDVLANEEGNVLLKG